MPVAVGGHGIPWPGEVELVDDAVGHTVAVPVRPEARVVEVDSGVDDHDGRAAAVDPVKAWVRAKRIHAAGLPDLSGEGLRL